MNIPAKFDSNYPSELGEVYKNDNDDDMDEDND